MEVVGYAKTCGLSRQVGVHNAGPAHDDSESSGVHFTHAGNPPNARATPPDRYFRLFSSAAAADGKRHGCGTPRVWANNEATQGRRRPVRRRKITTISNP